MTRCDSYYYFPIFTTYRNDVPLTVESGAMEIAHIRDMYYSYADRHNNHLSPYSEWHPDPLERRIHQYPDVEVLAWDDHDPQWYIGLDTSHALNGAYQHALQVFGDAVQPAGWNWREPWLSYDFTTPLAQLGMPYLLKPTSFYDGLYHLPFETLEELQLKVHHNNFYAMCLIASAFVINVVKMNNYHNLAHSGYMRGSPGFVAAHRYWCRLNRHPVTDRSEDNESTADFELIAQEQRESTEALAPPTPLSPLSPMEEETYALPAAAGSYPSTTNRENGATGDNLSHDGNNQFASANVELLQTIQGRRNDIDFVSDVATTGSPPVVPSSIPELDFDDLIERLTEIAAFRAANQQTGWGADTAEPSWEWPTEPAPPEAPSLGPPGWPSTAQESTPPIASWEDYWSVLRSEGLANQEDAEGSLVNHIIFTHPAAAK